MPPQPFGKPNVLNNSSSSRSRVYKSFRDVNRRGESGSMAGTLRPRLHCTGTTSTLEQKVLRFSCVYTAPVQKLYQIALPFTLYRSPLLIKSQYCYCALLKNKNTYHMS